MTTTFTLPAADLARRVEESDARSLELFEDLAPDQLLVPLAEIVNPFLWELGHVAFFYEVFLLRELGATTPLLEGADELYDSFSVEHDSRWRLRLPAREATLDYKRRVLDAVLARLPVGDASPRETYLYTLAASHEDMHDEAFTYMRQTLGYPEPRMGVELAGDTPGGGPCPGDVDVPGGVFRLGAEEDAPFVFDNEKWAHPVEVAPFRIARAPVTNAEFAEFVADEGYRRRALWSREGWTWRERAGANHPIHCRNEAGAWQRVHFDRRVPLEEHHPAACVSWYEAEAWCRWAGRRLPTEAEWELAATGAPTADGTALDGTKRPCPWGAAAPTTAHANLDWSRGGCVDVGALPAGDSAFGCRQMVGNVWEWTADAFYPFPGYVVDHPYREYSAPWFGDRKVLRGGSWATRSSLIRCTYRNFFPPGRNDVFTGFRTCAI